MKYISILFLTISSCASLIGQTLNSGEYIAVIGKGKGSYVPDMVTFNFNISVTDKKQNIAVQKLNDQSELAIKILSNIGYNQKDIKLSNFNLGKTVMYPIEKSKDNYFEANIEFELSIKYTENKFNAIIDTISSTRLPNLEFTYDMAFSDSLKTIIKNELIKKASDDAFQIATTLANSRNVSLGPLFSIEYTDNNFSLYGQSILPPPPPPLERFENSKMNAPRVSANIAVKGIQTEQQVRMIYKINNTR